MSQSVLRIFRDPEGALPNSLIIVWTMIIWLLSFTMMVADSLLLNIAAVFLCVHAMVLAAYLVHEAAHYTLFRNPAHNRWVGELMSFIAGACYASFERIRHLHIRHHRDRADVTCFDFKGLMNRQAWLKKLLQVMEWAYLPATEALMHLQVIWRPFFVQSQRRYLPRSLAVLVIRLVLLILLAACSMKALVSYAISYLIFLHVLNFFDAFHHTFEQFFVGENDPVPMEGRDRQYEQANTFSNVVSIRFPVLNLLTLNFGYHNAHHDRASVPWYGLPKLHHELYGARSRSVMPFSQLLKTWHKNRVRRVISEDYGAPDTGTGRADGFVGAHGVSFLTVI